MWTIEWKTAFLLRGFGIAYYCIRFIARIDEAYCFEDSLHWLSNVVTSTNCKFYSSVMNKSFSIQAQSTDHEKIPARNSIYAHMQISQ
jgi:hypothetical protein